MKETEQYEFKVGDVVRILHTGFQIGGLGSTSFNVGDERTIKEFKLRDGISSSSSLQVTFTDESGGYGAHYYTSYHGMFELVESAQSIYELW